MEKSSLDYREKLYSQIQEEYGKLVYMLIFIPLVSVFYTIFREFVYLRLKKQHIKRVTRTDVEEYAEEEIASSFIVPNEK